MKWQRKATKAWRPGRCLLRTLVLLAIAAAAIGVIAYSAGIIGDKVDKDTWNELLPPQLQFETKKPAATKSIAPSNP